MSTVTMTGALELDVTILVSLADVREFIDTLDVLPVDNDDITVGFASDSDTGLTVLRAEWDL